MLLLERDRFCCTSSLFFLLLYIAFSFLARLFSFFLFRRLLFHHHPIFSVSAAKLWSKARWQQLHVPAAAAGAGSSGDPGECLFIRRGQVDHEEDAVRHVLLRAGVGDLPVASDGGQELTVPLWVLQVFQGDHVGKSQLSTEAEALSTTPHYKTQGAEEESEEGDGRYGDVDGGSWADYGLAWTLVGLLNQT